MFYSTVHHTKALISRRSLLSPVLSLTLPPYLLLALNYFFYRILFFPAPSSPYPRVIIPPPLSPFQCTPTRITSPCLYFVFRLRKERENILSRWGKGVFLFGRECSYYGKNALIKERMFYFYDGVEQHRQTAKETCQHYTTLHCSNNLYLKQITSCTLSITMLISCHFAP